MGVELSRQKVKDFLLENLLASGSFEREDFSHKLPNFIPSSLRDKVIFFKRKKNNLVVEDNFGNIGKNARNVLILPLLSKIDVKTSTLKKFCLDVSLNSELFMGDNESFSFMIVPCKNENFDSDLLCEEFLEEDQIVFLSHNYDFRNKRPIGKRDSILRPCDNFRPIVHLRSSHIRFITSALYGMYVPYFDLKKEKLVGIKFDSNFEDKNLLGVNRERFVYWNIGDEIVFNSFRLSTNYRRILSPVSKKTQSVYLNGEFFIERPFQEEFKKSSSLEKVFQLQREGVRVLLNRYSEDLFDVVSKGRSWKLEIINNELKKVYNKLDVWELKFVETQFGNEKYFKLD